MEKKIISLDGKKVRTTSDLEQFIFRKDINRKISRTNVDNIKKQILNKSHLIVPVLVSDKNEILDGQNRVVAVKELVEEHKFDSNKDIELPYIVISYAQMEEAGVTIEDIIEGINSAGSNWNNSDKLKLASRNNSNITTLLELKAYFKLPTNIIFAILTGEFVQANMVVSKMQENDSIKLDFNDCIEQVGEFAKKFARMKIINSDIGTKVYESFIKISSESEITENGKNFLLIYCLEN